MIGGMLRSSSTVANLQWEVSVLALILHFGGLSDAHP